MNKKSFPFKYNRTKRKPRFKIVSREYLSILRSLCSVTWCYACTFLIYLKRFPTLRLNSKALVDCKGKKLFRVKYADCRHKSPNLLPTFIGVHKFIECALIYDITWQRLLNWLGETYPIFLANSAGIFQVARPGKPKRSHFKISVGEHVS